MHTHQHVPFMNLKAQHEALKDELTALFTKSIERCDFILGDAVREFEREFAEFVEARHAVGVSNGLDALRLTLEALDIGQGDEVIVPANTFIATALAVSQCGAKVVLVDCDPQSYGIDVTQIEAAITPRTKAILPVHLYGQAADMEPILQLAAKHNLKVVEDAAQAHGARHRSGACGGIADAGCFSFYPAKNLGCCGDGGIVTTNNDALADRLRSFRNYGQRAKYQHVEKGGNFRLDTLQAAILSLKLKHLPGWNSARNERAQEYRKLLDGVGDLRFQQLVEFSDHVYHLFIIETEHRDELQKYLSSHAVDTGIHYPAPVHLQEAYRDLGYGIGSFPNSERIATRILSLPMFPELTTAQVQRTADVIRSFFASR